MTNLFIGAKVGLFAFVLALFHSNPERGSEVGEPYVGWKKGEVDIHHIYTGRGESSFLILPDGTSLLIDAGDWDPGAEVYAYMTPLLPDSSKRAGEWIADYVKSVNPGYDHVDYLLISHFHSDHIGDARKGAGVTQLRQPNYQLSGIAQVGEYVSFRQLIDRAYPTYDYPLPMDADADITNYRKFVEWKMKAEGMEAASFQVGADDQIVLRREPLTYPGFSITNLFSNGTVWNEADNRIDTVYRQAYQKSDHYWNENTMSNGIKLAYGPFVYYSGGDLSGDVYDADGGLIDIEAYVGERFGPVDVCKANHHAYKDAMTPGFVKHMQARAYIVPVWDHEHIQPAIIARMADRELNQAESKVFFTDFPEVLKDKYGEMPWMNQIVDSGHVVVKVFDGGKQYKIYVLDATNSNRTVRAIYGPYPSVR